MRLAAQGWYSATIRIAHRNIQSKNPVAFILPQCRRLRNMASKSDSSNRNNELQTTIFKACVRRAKRPCAQQRRVHPSQRPGGWCAGTSNRVSHGTETTMSTMELRRHPAHLPLHPPLSRFSPQKMQGHPTSHSTLHMGE